MEWKGRKGNIGWRVRLSGKGFGLWWGYGVRWDYIISDEDWRMVREGFWGLVNGVMEIWDCVNVGVRLLIGL